MAIGGVIGSVVGGLAKASAAKKAAQVEAQAAADSNALQREIYYDNKDTLRPYREAGENALAAMQFEMGLAERPTFGGQASNLTIEEIGGTAGSPGSGGVPSWVTNPAAIAAANAAQGTAGQPSQFRVGDQVFASRDAAQAHIDAQSTGGTEYQGFQASPGYQFRVDQGQKALTNRLAASGMRLGGPAAKAMTDYGQGMASQEYGNYYNRLAGLSGTGQSAVNTTANLGQNYAGAVGANNRYGAEARASGYAGQANALSGVFNTVGNAFDAWRGGGYGGGA